MSKCHHRVQWCGETNRFAGKGEQTLSIRSPAVTAGGSLMNFLRSQASWRELERWREIKAEKIVPDFCNSFAESALRVASTNEKRRTLTR